MKCCFQVLTPIPFYLTRVKSGQKNLTLQAFESFLVDVSIFLLDSQLNPNATAADHLYSLSLKTLEQKQVEYLFCLRINNTKKKQIACEKLSAGLVGCARLSQWCNAKATLESPGSKLPERTLRLKMINLISCEPLAHISYIKLIRTDTVSEILHYLIFANSPRKG
ncbi:hypothetical protein WN943_016086 [Citrus x changshan-huyou]